MKNKKNFFTKFPLLLTTTTALLASQPQLDIESLFDMNIDQLQEIKVVTATKSSQKLNNVPANARVITAETIKERGYFSLEDALADLPGMQFRNIQGFNSYTFMRGAPSQNNLILMMVDGIVINELNSGGFYGGLQYNLSNVKRIEVVYGPGSALYGTNAISGVINIITNAPQDGSGSYASVTLGSFDTKMVDVRSSEYDKESKSGYLVSAMYKSTSKGDLGGAEGDYNWEEGMENFEDDLSLDARLKSGSFEMGIVVQDKKASRTTNYKSVGTDYIDQDTLWHITFMNIWAKHKLQINSDTVLNSTIFHRDATVQDDTIGYVINAVDDNNQTGYYRPNNLFGIEEQITYTGISGLDITAGGFYESENISESFSKSYSGSYLIAPDAPEKPVLMSNKLSGFYVQGMYELTKNLMLNAGIRHENSSYYGTVNTPRASMVYNSDDFTAKLIYAEAFRAPRPWDYNWGSIGNQGLLPEEMKSTEIFLGHKLTKTIKVDISLYSNKIYNKLTKATDGSMWINQGELDVNGAEISLIYMSSDISSYVNYTYTDSKDQDDIQMPEIATNTANAGVTYKLDKHIMTNLNVNYVGERKNPATPLQNVDAYAVANLKLSYLDFNGWDFDFMVKNLLDEEYYHTSNDSSVTPVSKYRQQQRSLYLGVGYRF